MAKKSRALNAELRSKSNADPSTRILFAPGDGGWRGFAVDIAGILANAGYSVYGLDTKRYLESLTGRKTLKEADVIADFAEMARWVQQGSAGRVTLVGWSEGAGLCLLAAGSEVNRKVFDGLVTVGLVESPVLGWRWVDNLTYVTKRHPDEPSFNSSDYMARVSPLPVLMIQSTQDEYVPIDVAERLFIMAKQPKKFSLIGAQNHRFDGNTAEFFRVLVEGIAWIRQTAP